MTRRPVPGDRHEDADLRAAARAIIRAVVWIVAGTAGGVALALWIFAG